MILLAITRHAPLVERLRMAFEGAGHRVKHVQDQLQALATEAWNDAQVILVDQGGDPMDGYRLCGLLRGEVRPFFRNLGIYLVLDGPPEPQDHTRLVQVKGDGFVFRDASVHDLLEQFGPALGGFQAVPSGPPIPVVAAGLPRTALGRLQGMLAHFGFEFQSCPLTRVRSAVAERGASILVLGVGRDGRRALRLVEGLREHGGGPYTVLVGPSGPEDLQRRLFLAGVAEWLPLPLSGPHLLHVCRRAVGWLQARAVKREFEQQLAELRERRVLLEMETAALRNEVLTDPMTGLLNRRAFDQNLDHALRQWERHHRTFVLILSDVDHFKLVNDRFGHLVGDRVLQALAQRLREALRRSDLAFRIGGEEFAVILPETGLEAGAEVAEKLRRCIDREPLVLEDGPSILPTMSFGVGAPGPGPAGRLFHEVDKLLYQAKGRGRNAVVVAPGPKGALRDGR